MSKKFKNKYRIESARLKNWDYGSNAAYFVTICTQNRLHFFGDISEITNNKNQQIMCLSEIGKLAEIYWKEIPNHFPFVKLGAFIVMPNHVHGIIIIDKPDDHRVVETLHATSLPPTTLSTTPPPINNINKQMASISPKQGTLSTIIRSYKSVVSKYARKIHADFAWQSRFYDHIIRNDESFHNITNYIKSNVLRWNSDKYCCG